MAKKEKAQTKAKSKTKNKDSASKTKSSARTKAKSSSGRTKAATKSSGRTKAASSKKVERKRAKNQAGLSTAFLDKMFKLLIKMREELSENLESGLLELQNTEKHHLADAEDMASDSTDDILVSQILEMGSVKLEEIDSSLEKIENGTYGVCEGMGEKIRTARLEALPHARLCIDCKRLQEKGMLEGFED